MRIQKITIIVIPPNSISNNGHVKLTIFNIEHIKPNEFCLHNCYSLFVFNPQQLLLLRVHDQFVMTTLLLILLPQSRIHTRHRIGSELFFNISTWFSSVKTYVFMLLRYRLYSGTGIFWYKMRFKEMLYSLSYPK